MGTEGRGRKKPGTKEKTFSEIITECEKLAYGIGGLTPAEFGDLTPAEFAPYINARIEREKGITKMENERVGLICATLQNGIPTISVMSSNVKHKASDYFGSPDATKETRKSSVSKIYDTMMAWGRATSKGGK